MRRPNVNLDNNNNKKKKLYRLLVSQSPERGVIDRLMTEEYLSVHKISGITIESNLLSHESVVAKSGFNS